MSSEELKLMPMPSLGEFIDWVWQLKEDRDAAIAQLAAIQGWMGEVVRYWHKPGIGFAVLDPQYYEDESGYVAYEDYAALGAENARLVEQLERWLDLDKARSAEIEAARAQLAAIQGGMGEVLCAEIKACATGRREDSPHTAHLMDRAAHAIAAMAAEVERLKAEVTRWHTLACNHSRAEDQLRAELAEVRGREAVAIKTHSAWGGLELLETLPDGTRLYTDPPASPDAAAATARAWELAAHLVKVLDLFDPNSRANVQTLVEAQAALLGGKP